MDAAMIQEALDDVFDQAIFFHAFTDYLRDYDVIIHATADPVTGIAPTYLRYRFKFCVEAQSTTALTPEIWRRSLDERLIDYNTGVDLDGYVWGVKWQLLYPGAKLISDSPLARQWTESVGIEFREVQFLTNGHDLRLVFSDLEVATLGPGYTPFEIPVDN